MNRFVFMRCDNGFHHSMTNIARNFAEGSIKRAGAQKTQRFAGSQPSEGASF